MRRPAVRTLLSRYAVAWFYVVAFSIAEIGYTLAPRRDQRATLRWASTNVHNLHHHPLGSLVASAFISPGWAATWPPLIALALFAACSVLGNWRTAAVCIAGHVIGTLVSEGIENYRITNGSVPASARYLIDVGPSYAVVAAIAVAILYGGWLARGAAALDLALLTFVGSIFAGLGQLSISAVGHVTALAVGVLGGSLAYVSRRRALRHRAAAQAGPAGRRVDDQNAQPRPRA